MNYLLKLILIILVIFFIAFIIRNHYNIDNLFALKNNIENFSEEPANTYTNAPGPNWLGEIDPNNTLIPYKYLKKNIDAKYMLDRLGVENKDPKLQIAPVTWPEEGRSTKFISSDVEVPEINSTRVPDNSSTETEIKIPNPSTNPQFEGPKMNMEYSQPIPPDTEESEQWFEKDSNNTKIIENIQNNKTDKKNDISEKACKFIGSYDRVAKCPTGYRNYLGASIGVKGSSLMCNNELMESDAATAVASINNGKLENIFITHPGSNYTNDPIVKIIGDGKNASAQALVKDGKVKQINVTNTGNNYQSTPHIEISKPEGDVYCHLCCKDFN